MTRIGVLGQLTIDDAAATLPPRERSVLAALVARRGHAVSADALADMLWGSSLPPTWSKALQGSVVRLRKELGGSAIETQPHGYCLVVPEEDIDAYRFERRVSRARELAALGDVDRAAFVADEALAMWRGDALTDVAEWEPARVEAVRLLELRLEAEEIGLDARLRAGRFREVLAEAHARVAEQQFRERRWAMLALAQYQAGRQGEALRTLRHARRTLADELGIDAGRDIAELEGAILRQDPALVVAEAAGASATCPYPGLVPYGVSDADGFFGRDAEVAAGLDTLRSVGILAVVGPSGSGKSSIVRAGIAAALERERRRVVVVTPGARPMDALAASSGWGPGAVLVVDQCEEAITLCDDAAERARFFGELVDHASTGPLVIALRADRLGELSAHPSLARLVERGLTLLPSMGESDLRAAIEGPARRAGLLLEAGLVDLLVREVEGEPGALPLLSHALRQTWLRREGRTMTVAGYRASGGIRGAVAQSAERLYEDVAPDERTLVRDLLLRLVAPGPEGDPVRSRVPRRAVATDPRHEEIIERFVAARLVTSDHDVVELAHESLARVWPRLRSWLDDDVDGQRIWRHLAVAADSWGSMGRPESELYRGIRLERALEWRELVEPDLNAVERTFLDVGKAAADGQRRAAKRRRRTFTSIVGAAAVVALVFASLAVIQARRAEAERDRAVAAEGDAEIEALVNRSLALRQSDRAAAALLAVEAYRRAPSDPRVHSALLGTFTGAPGFMGYRHLPDESLPLSGAVVPGSSLAVVAMRGRDLEMVDLETGAVERRFDPLDNEVVSRAIPSIVRVSADGRFVAHLVPTQPDGVCGDLDVMATTDDEGCATLLVHELASGRIVLGPTSTPVGPGDVAINADGSLVAVAGGFDGDVVVYRIADGEALGRVDGPPRPDGVTVTQFTAALAFGPDGRLYAGSMAGAIQVIDTATTTGLVAVDDVLDGLPLASNKHVAVTIDGLLVAAGHERLVAVDLASGTVQWSSEIAAAGDSGPCRFFAVAEAVGRFYCGNFNGVLEERELATGERTGRRLDPQLGSVGDLAAAMGGTELVAFGGDVPVVTRWRLDGSGPTVETYRAGWGTNGYDPAGDLMVAFEGERVHLQDTVVPPPDFFVWDPATGEVVDEMDHIVAAVWAAPGRLGALFDDGRTGFYDVREHRRLEGLPPPEGGTVGGAWRNADSTRLFVGFNVGAEPNLGCVIQSIDVVSLEAVGPLIEIPRCSRMPDNSGSATADSALFAFVHPTAEGWATDLYDARTGEFLRGPLPGFYTAVFAADGTAVGANRAGDIVQYDPDTLETVGAFPGARGAVEWLEFSSDSTLLLGGSNDRTVTLYDVATRSQLGDPIDAGRSIVGGNAGTILRPDGGAVAVNGRDGLAIWTIEPDRLAEAACEVAGRNLTSSEWDSYLADLGAFRDTCPL